MEAYRIFSWSPGFWNSTVIFLDIELLKFILWGAIGGPSQLATQFWETFVDLFYWWFFHFCFLCSLFLEKNISYSDVRPSALFLLVSYLFSYFSFFYVFFVLLFQNFLQLYLLILLNFFMFACFKLSRALFYFLSFPFI